MAMGLIGKAHLALFLGNNNQITLYFPKHLIMFLKPDGLVTRVSGVYNKYIVI